MPLHPDISLMSYVAGQIKKRNLFLSLFNRFGVISGLWSHTCAILSVLDKYETTSSADLEWASSLPFKRHSAEFLFALTVPSLLFLSLLVLCCYIWSHRLPFSLTLDYTAPTVGATPGCIAPCFQITFVPFFSHGNRAQSPSKRFATNNLSCSHPWGSKILQVQKLKPEHNYFGLDSLVLVFFKYTDWMLLM